MKDFKNYNEITTRMVEFTDKAPAHLRGKKIPIGCGDSDMDLHFDARFDMDNLIAYELCDNEYAKLTNLPTINELVKDGIVARWKPYKEADLDRIDEKPDFYKNGKPRIKAIKKYFKARGFTISTEAIMHNLKAWKRDYKSGYRDEVNNCHVFSACGCNPFGLYVTELYPACDWQTTYTC